MRICVENGTFTVSFLKEGLLKFRGWVDDLLKTSWDACQGSDVLIECPSAMGGIHIAEALQIPCFQYIQHIICTGLTWLRLDDIMIDDHVPWQTGPVFPNLETMELKIGQANVIAALLTASPALRKVRFYGFEQFDPYKSTFLDVLGDGDQLPTHANPQLRFVSLQISHPDSEDVEAVKRILKLRPLLKLQIRGRMERKQSTRVRAFRPQRAWHKGFERLRDSFPDRLEFKLKPSK